MERSRLLPRRQQRSGDLAPRRLVAAGRRPDRGPGEGGCARAEDRLRGRARAGVRGGHPRRDGRVGGDRVPGGARPRRGGGAAGATWRHPRRRSRPTRRGSSSCSCRSSTSASAATGAARCWRQGGSSAGYAVEHLLAAWRVAAAAAGRGERGHAGCAPPVRAGVPVGIRRAGGGAGAATRACCAGPPADRGAAPRGGVGRLARGRRADDPRAVELGRSPPRLRACQRRLQNLAPAQAPDRHLLRDHVHGLHHHELHRGHAADARASTSASPTATSSSTRTTGTRTTPTRCS